MTGEEELATIGYAEDGVVWITVTPETATPEAALAFFADGDHARMAWKVRGRRDLVLDATDEHEMYVPAGLLAPDGSCWELTAPGFVYGEEPWETLEPPETEA